MLAQATGIYRERPAAGPLSDHFDCAWVHRLPASQTRTILVVPDGSIDLQWLGGALRIAGPDREPQTEALAPGAIVVGFRFRPGHAAAWLGLAATEMLNRRIPLDEIWGREASRLAEEVSAARGVADLVQRLERGLARRAAGRAPSRGSFQAAYQLLAEGAPPGKALIPWLAEELALSERTLRRRFGEAFGYGPKSLERILRFQRFLALLRGAGPRSLAELAAAAGYADQAHLTRESRRLAGGTPGELAVLLAGREFAGPL
ncbi:MAG TPA: helix-turn-helix domain-containing protein [Verrucomicrobiae bacterium]|nr:helix-turn-helix domain-containing protein [Verrucomicrobiae bacterium]